jgi:hypothetical protein
MPLALRSTCTLVAASFGIAFAHPAAAASTTVFWDGVGGFGVSQATAFAAQAAGITVRDATNPLEFNFPSGGGTPKISVTHPAALSNVVIPAPVGIAPATGQAGWTGTNTSGLNQAGALDTFNLYLIFAQPLLNDEFTVNGQPQPVEYDPADVGLQLSSGEAGLADWEILRVLVAGSDPVYYPAVSLGALADGSTLPFDLFYTLKNPQVFGEPFNFVLGIPKWNLFFTSLPTVVPEPSPALLVLIGLGTLVGARRARM